MEVELSTGLTVAAVYFHQTLGVPVEIFNEWITGKLTNRAEQWLWYMNFRNRHPDLYENIRP